MKMHIKAIPSILEGEIGISGAKNAVLPILVSSLFYRGQIILKNVPEISDVSVMLNLLSENNTKYEWIKRNTLFIDNSNANNVFQLNPLESRKIRYSVLFLGAALGLKGSCTESSPGGCNIGKRPIDIHIDGFKKMGYRVENEVDHLYVCYNDKYSNKDIVLNLRFPTVSGTENLILAALGRTAKTIIKNSALEPEIDNMISFLNKVGYFIYRNGYGDIIVESLKGRKENKRQSQILEWEIIPDRIEGFTYFIMGLLKNSNITLKNFPYFILNYPIALIKSSLASGKLEMDYKNRTLFLKSKDLRFNFPRTMETAPYPGFPTDCQPLITPLITKKSLNKVILEEKIYENRFDLACDLNKLGEEVYVEDGEILISNNGNKVDHFKMAAKDIRHGAGLIIYSLTTAEGAVIDNYEFVQRGYERMDEKLRQIGVKTEVYE